MTSATTAAGPSRSTTPRGDLTLEYDALEIPADPGQTIVAYSAPSGSAARKALDQLASWTTAPNDATAITSDQPG
jgi:transcription regulator MmyB-like protein